MSEDKNRCMKCLLLSELYDNTKRNARDYYVMTELFVLLHGSDICTDDKSDEGESISFAELNTAL